jgi:hypothetical protein
MPFCPGCGHQHAADDRFCAECGRELAGPTGAGERSDAPEPSGPLVSGGPERTLWEGQPHGVLNPIESRAVRYELTTERLRVIRGILSRSVDEIELTRVRDVMVEQSLTQRALGIGNVRLVTTDATSAELLLHDVEDPEQIKELVRQAVREQRHRLRVRQLEDI